MKLNLPERLFALLSYILNYINPKFCFLCKSNIKNTGLCGDCWKRVNFISQNSCSYCGCKLEIFANFIHNDNLCEMCNLSNIYNLHLNCSTNVERNFSVFMYENLGKNIILQLKNKNYWYIIPFLKSILSKNIINHDVVDAIDLIVPVPLHYIRLLYRGYNQSEIIGKILADNLEKKIKNVLKRCKQTIPQEKMNLEQRQANLANAFLLKKKFISLIHNKTILLVDDVMTTGTTLNACALALKSAGAKKVYSFTLAKTHTPQFVINNLWMKNGKDAE